MSRYYIEAIKYGEADGGIACGPVGGAIVAEVKIRIENGEVFYLSLADACGFPNFFKTLESTFEQQLQMDEDIISVLEDAFIETGDYEEIFEKKDSEWFELYRYLIFFVSESEEACKEIEKLSVGKYIDEIEIPASEYEIGYYEMQCEV